MSEQPQPLAQREGESREAYVARISALAGTDWAEGRRVATDLAVRGVLRRGVVWFFRHWLLLFNLGYALMLAFAFVGPYLYSVGASNVGGFLFGLYNIICDQVPTHSYYVGGFQVCLCQRCLAIYGAMLLGGLIYAVMRRQHSYRPLALRWMVLASLPIIVDGVTQLYGLRHSDIFLRSLTGGLFGFAAVATIYPWFDAVQRRLWRVLGIVSLVYNLSNVELSLP